MPSYRAVSSDSHIVEPGDLWENRIEPKFRDRAPRVVSEEEFDQWYCDGVAVGALGTSQQAGMRFEEPEMLRNEGRMDTMPLGAVDPDAHVKDMALDGISGGVLYPSHTLTMFRVPASDLLSAVFRGYNDYIAEFCGAHPNQLKGISMINLDVIEDGVKELQRVAKLGLAGAAIPIRPMLRYDHPAYDRFWATAQDLNIPLSLHTGTMRWRPGDNTSGTVTPDPVEFPNREYHVRQCITAMIFSGVFERYPKVMVGAVEFEVSWAPYFIAAIDSFYTERAMGVRGNRFKGDLIPSDFIHNNVFFAFQEDDLGIQMRHKIGVDNLLWGSDYPHAESTFPKSREIIERILEGVPEDEKAKIAGENTARLYHFD